MQTPVRRSRLPGVYQEHIPHRRPPAMPMGSDLSYNIIIIVNFFARFVKGESAFFLPFCKIIFQSCFFLRRFPLRQHRSVHAPKTPEFCQRTFFTSKSTSGHEKRRGFPYNSTNCNSNFMEILAKTAQFGYNISIGNTNNRKGEDYNGTDRT